MRTVVCKVRPVPLELRAHLRASFGTLQYGQDILPPLFIRRRTFLRMSVAASAVLPFVPVAACEPQTGQNLLLAAVELAKVIFKLVEEIRGSFVVSNPSNKQTNLEIATNLMTGEGFKDMVESVKHIVKLPPGTDMMLADWGDVYGQSTGKHLISAQEGGRDPIESDHFDVTE